MKRSLTLIATAAIALSLSCGHRFNPGAQKEAEIPSTRVQRGSVELIVTANGELRSPHSAMITAPPIGGSLQIVRLARNGSPVKAGEVILEFDASEQEFNLEQGRSQLDEAEQQIVKSKADAAVQAAQDKVALLKARFDVRRAELEVGKNELVGEIDARKNVLALTEAKRRLAQLEQDVVSRKLNTEAGIAVQVQTREAARLQMQVAQRNIDIMKVTSPIDGVVSIKENQDATGGMWYPGIVLPEYREGDQVNAGRMVAQVYDIGTIEVAAKINETDRVNVNPGASAELQVDLVPERQYKAKVKSVAALASHSMYSSNTVPKFDALFDIVDPDRELRPGASAMVTVRGATLSKTLFLPRQCLFQKDGKEVVYVRESGEYKPREIKVVNQTEARIVIQGLAEGAEVAMIDPTTVTTKSAVKPGQTGVAQ